MEIDTKTSRYLRVFAVVGALLLICLLMTGIFGFSAVSTLSNNHKSVQNTLSIIASLRSLNVEVLEAYKEKQVYLLNKQPEHVNAFYRAIEAVRSTLRVLDVSETEIPKQQLQFTQLRQEVEKALDFFELAVITENNKRGKTSIGTLRKQSDDQILERIAKLIAVMEDAETDLLLQRTQEAEETKRLIQIAMILLTLISVLLMLLAIYALHVLRDRAEQFVLGIETLNANLEAKVNERTEQLEHYSNELQRSNRELQNFAFAASHDLQEPLRKIRAFGDRLERMYADKLEGKGLDYLNRCLRSAERMSVLIDDLLAFSRVSTRGNTFKPVPLQDVVDDVLDTLDELIAETGTRVLCSPLPTVDGDASQLSHVFQNLITNSIKFRHPDRSPEISISAWDIYDEDSEQLHTAILFADNGIGIAEEFAQQIFTMFQRLHARDEYEGSGIGLAICRRIIERHAGNIRLDTEYNDGARFIIELPYQHAITQEDIPHVSE